MRHVHHALSRYFPTFIGFVGLIFLLLSVPLTTAAAQNALNITAADAAQDTSSEEVALTTLLSEALEKGTVRVIVKLATGAQTGSHLSSAQEAIAQQAAIAQAQEGLLASLSDHHVANVEQFQHLPYLVMTVDEMALEALIGHQAVARIFKDEMHFPTLAESVPLIHADQTHAAGLTGKGWTVAILDTGVAKTHPFLDEGKVVSEACYSTTDTGRSVSSLCPNGQSSQVGAGAGVNCSTQIDGCEHGTHVAGIAAGNATGTPIPNLDGVAKGTNIMAIQVFSRVDDASACAQGGHRTPCTTAFTSDIMRGLERVLELRTSFQIAAVNLSLGGSKFTSTCDAQSPLTDTIQLLRSANIATVIASGNNGFADGISQPACVSSAISVGNTTKGDAVNSSSNSASFSSLLAPGTHIVASVPSSPGVAALTGTSMAAPHVAGAFALLRQAKPSASVSEILAALQKTGVPIRDPRNGITKPRIDVQAALDVLSSRGTPEITDPVPGSTLAGATVTFTWHSNGAAVTEWWLYIGSSQGAADLLNSGSLGTRLSVTVSNLPTDRRRLFVRLWYRIAGQWQFGDFPYLAH
jgi:subtilisin